MGTTEGLSIEFIVTYKELKTLEFIGTAELLGIIMVYVHN
jgi:hypothetical protein